MTQPIVLALSGLTRRFGPVTAADHIDLVLHRNEVLALLSGGYNQKLILARVLDRNPDLSLADQPTRGLDFDTVGDVGPRLLEARQYEVAVIVISWDLDEILLLADRSMVMHDRHLIETNSRDRATIGLLMAGRPP